jgi:hypothetical protein
MPPFYPKYQTSTQPTNHAESSNHTSTPQLLTGFVLVLHLALAQHLVARQPADLPAVFLVLLQFDAGV